MSSVVDVRCDDIECSKAVNSTCFVMSLFLDTAVLSANMRKLVCFVGEYAGI